MVLAHICFSSILYLILPLENTDVNSDDKSDDFIIMIRKYQKEVYPFTFWKWYMIQFKTSFYVLVIVIIVNNLLAGDKSVIIIIAEKVQSNGAVATRQLNFLLKK